MDFKTDLNGDLLIQDYDFQLVTGIDAIIQSCAIRLRFFLNDWFLDINVGIPYYEEFFIKAPNQIRLESIIKDTILGTEGITEITSFSSTFNPSKRIFNVQFTAIALEEEINLEIDLP